MKPGREKAMGHPTGLRVLVSRVLTDYNREHGSLFAKGLGFSFVVGGMSLLFLALSVGAYIFHASPGLQRVVTEQILGFLPPQIGTDFIERIIAMTDRWGSMGIITIGVFLFTAFALFDSLERTMVAMLEAPRRTFLMGQALTILMLCAAVLLFYASAALSVLSNYFRAAFRLPAATVYLGAKAASLFLNTCVFFVLYRLFARRKLRIGRTAAIAVTASRCWELLGTAGAALIRLAGRRFLIYGAIAWAVMIMIYVRVLGEIVVFSSILVRVLNPKEDPVPAAAEK